ncbi:MAG: hypothetical protein ACE15D_07455 [Candidatus Eisenbacteria bacterium]
MSEDDAVSRGSHRSNRGLVESDWDQDAFVERVMRAAQPELLRRRRGHQGIEMAIVRLRMPVLAACGLLAAASLVLLAVSRESSAQPLERPLAAALGVPDRLAIWALSEDRPAPAELLTFDEERR